MQRLFPDPAPTVDLAEAYGRLASLDPHRPAVRLNMIASIDGAASRNGHTARLAGSTDHQVFALLRSLTDVILIGAGTLNAENYGPAQLDETATARRTRLGLVGTPAIAVLTRSCRLDWASPLFVRADPRPIVLTTHSADPADRTHAEAVADVIVAGNQTVNLAHALRGLADRGVRSVLAEGGPRVSAQLAAAGLLDELCLSLAPQLIAGNAARILNGPELAQPTTLELRQVLESDGYLFLSYLRRL